MIKGVHALACLAAAVTIGTACGDDDADDTPGDEGVSALEAEYLERLESVAPDRFVSDQAALNYVVNYCEFEDREPADDAEAVVADYCDTELAEP
jgi:hypothetical protein